MHDAAIRIRRVAARLGHLAEALDERAFRDLMGAVEVEVETGEEAVIERAHRRPSVSEVVIVPFPNLERRLPEPPEASDRGLAEVATSLCGLGSVAAGHRTLAMPGPHDGLGVHGQCLHPLSDSARIRFSTE